MILLPFLFGMIFSIPFYLLYWSFFSSIFNNWTFPSLFFHYYLNRDGLASFYISVILILLLTFAYKRIDASRLREVTAYIAGMFFTLALYDVLTAEEWYGFLELFISPILRIALLLALAVTINRYNDTDGWYKYLWAAGAVLAPFVTNAVPVLYSLKMVLPSIILLLTLTLASVVFYLLESRRRL